MSKVCKKCGFVTQQDYFKKCIQCRSPFNDITVKTDEVIKAPSTPMVSNSSSTSAKTDIRPIQEIVWSMSALLPMTLFSAFLYGLLILGGIVLLLNKTLWYDIELARLIAFISTPIILALLSWWYFIHFVNKCKRHKLEASKSDLSIAGSTNKGFIETSIKYSDIESIQLGKELNVIDNIVGIIKPGTANIVRDIKEGTLVIALKNGDKIELSMAYKVFVWRSMIETIRFVRERLA